MNITSQNFVSDDTYHIQHFKDKTVCHLKLASHIHLEIIEGIFCIQDLVMFYACFTYRFQNLIVRTIEMEEGVMTFNCELNFNNYSKINIMTDVISRLKLNIECQTTA